MGLGLGLRLRLGLRSGLGLVPLKKAWTPAAGEETCHLPTKPVKYAARCSMSPRVCALRSQPRVRCRVHSGPTPCVMNVFQLMSTWLGLGLGLELG